MDFRDPTQLRLSAPLQVNSDYAGGSLRFPEAGGHVEPKEGTVVAAWPEALALAGDMYRKKHIYIYMYTHLSM